MPVEREPTFKRRLSYERVDYRCSLGDSSYGATVKYTIGQPSNLVAVFSASDSIVVDTGLRWTRITFVSLE